MAEFFSIIIPVYNVNFMYFDVCMNSILNQTICDYEVIIVDDGSKKECADLCDQYAEKYEQVHVIHREKQEGVSAARNLGVQSAHAEWIMFVDADDWIETNTCETLKMCLQNVSCDILMFDAVKEFSSKKERMNYGLEDRTLYSTADVPTREMLYIRAMGSNNTKSKRMSVIYYSWGKIYRRSFLINNNILFPYGIKKSEDKVFILTCFQKMQSLYYVKDVFYHYRIHESSVCHSYSEDADTDRLALSRILESTAKRMDKELGEKKNNFSYNEITKQYTRFIFGIITDVFENKYYHSEYPRSNKERNKEVKVFLNTEPFRSSIRSIKYSDLPRAAKIKKFLLLCGMHRLLYFAKKYRKNKAGNIPQNY